VIVRRKMLVKSIVKNVPLHILSIELMLKIVKLIKSRKV